MSAYANDPRVYLKESGTYWVELPGIPGQERSQDGYVAPRPDGSFEASIGWSDITRRTFATADDAIRSWIGDPR